MSRGGGGSRFPWCAGGSLASALCSPCALSEAPTGEQVLGPQDTLGPHLVWDRHQVKGRDKGRRSRAGSCGFCVFLNNSFVEIAFTHHRTHPYEVYNLMAFTIFTELCSHHLCLIPEHSISAKGPQCPAPVPDTRNPLSVSVDLPVLDVSHQWNHTLCVLLCLASLTEHRVLRVHPRCSECQCFSPFHG